MYNKKLFSIFISILILNFNYLLPKSKSKVKIEPELQFSESAASESRHNDDLATFFLKPIDFSQDGLNRYFKYVYNHPEYAHHLSYSLSHMLQFLEYGKESEQSEAFAASVVKLFMQKLKATPFIDADSYVEFLPKFTEAVKPYLNKKESSFLKQAQSALKERLTHVFSKYFSYFQSNPDNFMDSLSEQIAKQANQLCTTQHVEIEQLKKDLLRFIELCSGKFICSSSDDIHVWYICNRLAQEAHQCLDEKILPGQDSFDDICWSLIHRFCYFIELSGSTLSRDFYDQVLLDLATKPLILTMAEEQEELIVGKRAHLKYHIQAAKDLTFPVANRNLDAGFNFSKGLSLA